MKKRENFTSRTGFIISCIGAAVGLGNIWMFPYRLGQNGGGAFLIPYFIFVLTLGSAGLITEFAFGRSAEGGALTGIKNGFKNKGLKGGALVGIIPAVGLAGIFIFYNIVVGWIIKYLALSVSGNINKIDISTYFDSFSGSFETIFWTMLAIGLAVIIVCMGISKGIEKINKIIMPLLFVIFILLAIRSLTLPGAMGGVKYLLTPQWEYLFKVNTWVMALGQAFFTVSLNGCGMVVYGSYIKKDLDIPRAAFSTAIIGIGASLLAAFVIMPAVFAFGLDPSAGPELLFITIPIIFKAIPGGQILMILFFISLLCASISSTINMLEGPVESFMAQTKLSRKKSTILIAVGSFIFSIPLSLNMNLFNGVADFITIVVSPVAALIVFIVFYYMYDKRKVLEEINMGAEKNMGEKFYLFAKYGFVVITILVIVLGIVYGRI
ncbi:sodium-dependent transporter [Clostridium gasigenes]|uniref:sodium-dependent transporter n=1 Tax=Clostridium gasigenes TaxID=94869 RepID=UPI001C0E5F4E|nr:sodium-dependent transporter [Clostridium gasigenes]MBU3106088.1 sodium-dependent transporter [Clostridium gasigenes]